MAEAVFFKHGNNQEKARLTGDGSLELGSLAVALGLDPMSVRAGEFPLEYNPSTGQCQDFATVLQSLRQKAKDDLLGTSSEKAILLEGRPADDIRQQIPELEAIKIQLKAALQDALAPIAQLMKLTLLMNLKPASYGSESEDYRGPALAAYQVSNGDRVLCQVSDRYFPATMVEAAHIIRLEWSPVAAHMGVRISSPENIILMHHKIAAAYARQQWCLLVQPDGSMQVEVLKKSLLEHSTNRGTIVDGNGELGNPRDPGVRRGSKDKLCWADLQRQELIIPSGSTTQPAKRCVALHALAACEHAVGRGWIQKGEVVVPETGWSSRGFDEQLMGKLLHDASKIAGEGSCSEGASDAAPCVDYS